MRGGYNTAEMMAQRNRCRVAQLALYEPPFRDFVVCHPRRTRRLCGCFGARRKIIWVLGTHKSLRLAIFSIETFWFYALMQIFCELH